MLTTIACAAALTLAPAQGGQMTLSKPTLTYGVLGAPRNNAELLPGDVLFVSFDVENITVDKQGRILYSMSMEVVEANNRQKVLYRQEPRDLEARNMLGGSKLPVFFHVNTGLDQPPGDYILIMSITDRVAKVTKSIEQPFKVLKPDFGLVRLQLSFMDSNTPERFPAPTVGVVGQIIWINFAAVGYQRDQKKEPNIRVEMRILDEAGQATLAEPFTGDTGAGIPENLRLIPMQFFLALNRPGKFAVELKATDQISKKTTTMTFPITVLAPQ